MPPTRLRRRLGLVAAAADRSCHLADTGGWPSAGARGVPRGEILILSRRAFADHLAGSRRPIPTCCASPAHSWPARRPAASPGRCARSPALRAPLPQGATRPDGVRLADRGRHRRALCTRPLSCTGPGRGRADRPSGPCRPARRASPPLARSVLQIWLSLDGTLRRLSTATRSSPTSSPAVQTMTCRSVDPQRQPDHPRRADHEDSTAPTPPTKAYRRRADRGAAVERAVAVHGGVGDDEAAAGPGSRPR